MDLPTPPFVKNAELLTSLSHTWSNFHDAEVVELHLQRRDADAGNAPSLALTLMTTWGVRCYVSLRFEKVEMLKLADFNHQNVLYSLELERSPGPADEPGRISVTMATSHGLEGTFTCAGAEVTAVKQVS